MSRLKPSKIRLLPFCAITLLLIETADAFPTWIGIAANVQRQTGGNPGTFTILMNQYYSTLHASVGISVNGFNWKEYPMSYAGTTAGNSKWSLTPAAIFPAGAVVSYYFRGWDDAGGSISDGTTAASYSFVPSPPLVISIPGDVDLYGSSLSMGGWLDDINHASFSLSSSDNGTGNISVVRLTASRPANDWLWERALAGGAATAPMMKLDSLNRLSLFDPANATSSTIVLNPGGGHPEILINGEHVLTSAAAATSYLPVNAVHLTIGVNNSAGVNAIATGSESIASGNNSAAVGDHVKAQGFGQFVAGSFNTPQGSATAPEMADQLFAIGNGTDESHRSNALTVLRDGRVGVGTASPTVKLDVQGDARISGNLNVIGVIRIAPQGDLSMGEFTQGVAP
jgi:hypothetical protein